MLSKTAQKRLDRITEIQDDIQKLYAQLEMILGGEDELSPKNLDAAVTRMEKGTRMMIPKKRGDPCTECGSKGTRHFKTCSQSPQPAKVSVALTVDQYDELRDAMFEKDFQSMPFAMTNKMSPKEVNLAVQTTSYADYLNKRKAV